jgi:hypothetical protein
VAEAERSGPFDICWSASLISDAGVSAAERCARGSELAAAGVTWATVTLPAADRADLLTSIARFGHDVIDEVGPA